MRIYLDLCCLKRPFDDQSHPRIRSRQGVRIMVTTLLDQPQLRTKGFEVLVESLGWVNAVRFLQQYESSSLNYVRERDAILPELSAAELLKELDATSRAKP